ncbi:hypothetical protein Pmani_013530 [Petrolisthes manimaculis]|uniref:Uncharacterized protein n=1 Tax=Petrolisthes manimaculis TaxID=1843537 RepID=A0AAE1PXB7_9EUCA|nr:hypothetical protein Pmani_013530 [Petrolisthes manimaculis]
MEFARYSLFKFCWHCGTELTTRQGTVPLFPLFHRHPHFTKDNTAGEEKSTKEENMMRAAEVNRERFAINKSYSIEVSGKP